MQTAFNPIIQTSHRASKNLRSHLTREALSYHERGWTVIPTDANKRAVVKWKGFQRNPLSKGEVRDMFREHAEDAKGLAVILGSASGGLVCRDFDNLDKYKEWASKYRRLAESLPTVKTPRPGRHVYFRGPNRFQECKDGEYRGDNLHYVCLPPSLHPSGKLYRWKIGLPSGDLPEIDPYESGLFSLFTERSERTEEVLVYHNHYTPLPDLDKATRRAITKAIRITLPDAVGQRHHKVFELARRFKGIDALRDVDPRVLKPFVRTWHDGCVDVIGTKEFEVTWVDFVDGWGRKPLRWRSIIAIALERFAACFVLPATAGSASSRKIYRCWDLLLFTWRSCPLVAITVLQRLAA